MYKKRINKKTFTLIRKKNIQSKVTDGENDIPRGTPNALISFIIIQVVHDSSGLLSRIDHSVRYIMLRVT